METRLLYLLSIMDEHNISNKQVYIEPRRMITKGTKQKMIEILSMLYYIYDMCFKTTRIKICNIKILERVNLG